MTFYINGWYVLGAFVYFLISYGCLAVVSESLPGRTDWKTVFYVIGFFLFGPIYMLYGFLGEAFRDGWRWVCLRVYPLQFVTTWVKIKIGYFDADKWEGFVDDWNCLVNKNYATRPLALKGDLYLIRLLRQRIADRAKRK